MLQLLHGLLSKEWDIRLQKHLLQLWKCVFLKYLDDTSFCNTFFKTDFALATFISPEFENIAEVLVTANKIAAV